MLRPQWAPHARAGEAGERGRAVSAEPVGKPFPDADSPASTVRMGPVLEAPSGPCPAQHFHRREVTTAVPWSSGATTDRANYRNPGIDAGATDPDPLDPPAVPPQRREGVDQFKKKFKPKFGATRRRVVGLGSERITIPLSAESSTRPWWYAIRGVG
jgi:hypothetical protein